MAEAYKNKFALDFFGEIEEELLVELWLWLIKSIDTGKAQIFRGKQR